MAVSVDQFGKAIVASGLMAADELKSLWSAIPAAERPKNADAFAKLLMQQGTLNEFQSQELLAGSGTPLVLGDYVLLSKIGAGGMGQVFKAEHRHMKRLVAVKLLPAALTKDEATVKRFQREVQAAAKLSHPNIVQAYDASVQRGVWYLVMEYVEGRDLAHVVKARGPLPVEEAVSYITQAARGLAFAHGKGVVHRDIKPANLLLDNEGTVKILDMGLARFDDAKSALEAAEEGLTQSGQVMGTVDYMAPEQAFDTRHADARADVYSLGCSLYRLLTGENVYSGDTVMQKFLAHREKAIPSLSAKRADVSEALDAVFRKMVAKLPDDRYQPTSQLVAELETCATPASSTTKQGISLDLSTFIPRSPLAAAQGTGVEDGMTAALGNQLMRSVPDSRVAPRDETFSSSSNDRTQRGGRKQKTKILGGKKPPWQNPLVLSAAGAGALLLVLLGVWVIVRDKEGNPVAKVEVPDGGSVKVQEVKKSPLAKSANKTEAAKNTPATIDVIQLLDLDRDRVAVASLTGANEWSKSGGKLKYTSDARAGKLVAPIDVKDARDYEIVVEVRRLSGSNAFTVDFAASEQLWCGLDVNVPGPILLKVEGGQRPKIGDWPVEAKDGGRLVVRVRHGAENQAGSVRLSVNGQPVGQWDGVVSKIGNRLLSHPDFTGSMNVGLFCFRDSFEFSSWQLLVHDGTARLLRSGDSAIVGTGTATTSKITNINDPAFQQWMKAVQAMPVEKQIEAVSKKLIELNPGFDGKLTDYDGAGTPKVEKGMITEIGFLTDNVTDISPVRALTGLTSLSCGPAIATVKRKLSDLSPLQGMKLNRLTCSHTLVADLSPLQGMALATLKCDNSKVAVLSPLQGMPLTHLKCDYSQVADLSPLRGMLLTNLSCGYTRVTDLSPIHGMPLEYLSFPFTSVSDLTPVAGMPLKGLGCHNTKVSDLTPLQGMTLTSISCSETQVSDLSPLLGMNMREVWITPQNITKGIDIIRQMKSVKVIYTKTSERWLPAEFWKKYEAGEFGKPAAAKKLAYPDPDFQKWIVETQKLPAQQQIEAVRKKLIELNPGFDGKVADWNGAVPPSIENNVVTELSFVADGVPDASPVRALVGLKKLWCYGSRPGTGKLSDLSQIRGMSLTHLSCANTQVSDLSPLEGMPLTYLTCSDTHVTSLSPLQGMKLTTLYCGHTNVGDLSPLRGMSLSVLFCGETRVTDLSPIQGMPLTKFSCHHTQVFDLFPLEGTKLTEIYVTPANITKGLDVIRQMKSLKTIAINKYGYGQHPADEFWKKYDIGELGKPITTFKDPGFRQWMNDVQALPADKQIEAVSKKLAELNPGFGGKVTGFDGKGLPIVKDGVMTEFGFHIDNLFDLSPVRALPHLTRLRCRGNGEGNGKLSDLSPLEGIKLTDLDCGKAKLLENLSPLHGMPLTSLSIYGTSVSGLSPLQGMKLNSLYLSASKVMDMTPLKGMKLTKLFISNMPISSLAPLAGMSLTQLECDQTNVSDLSPLRGMQLTRLHCFATPVSDLSPLAGMPLGTLWAWDTKIADVRPLQECKKLGFLKRH